MNIKATVKNSDLGAGISSRLTPDDMSAILEQLLSESTQGVTQSRALECSRILVMLVTRVHALLDDAQARIADADARTKTALDAETHLAFAKNVASLMRKLEPTDDEALPLCAEQRSRDARSGVSSCDLAPRKRSWFK